MFGLFSSVEKQMRDNASNWLELADKIFHYRRDLLSPADLTDLRQKTETLRAQLKAKDDASKLKLGIESLEGTLRRTGGKFYPRSTLQEYVEFFVVAAIVVIGIQMYFFRPFKIPTNSMWPTYYGMTGEVFPTKADEPGMLGRAARFALFGATRRSVDAPADGEVWVAIGGNRHDIVSSAVVDERSFGVIPGKAQLIAMRVGDEVVTLTVPIDFRIDRVFRDAFFPEARDFGEAAQMQKQRGRVVAGQVPTGSGNQRTDGYWMKLGKSVKKGDRILSFDVMSGDMLFVDRISYHFVQPAVGSGFVFRTKGIAGIGADQYYIKRLAGTPGDKLEIRPPLLMRNDAPITGAKAFDMNFSKTGLYRGYQAIGELSLGRTVTLGQNKYYALGDNSYESADSRYWGHVPAEDVVGRPLFVYYPFTKRWGPGR